MFWFVASCHLQRSERLVVIFVFLFSFLFSHFSFLQPTPILHKELKLINTSNVNESDALCLLPKRDFRLASIEYLHSKKKTRELQHTRTPLDRKIRPPRVVGPKSNGRRKRSGLDFSCPQRHLMQFPKRTLTLTRLMTHTHTDTQTNRHTQALDRSNHSRNGVQMQHQRLFVVSSPALTLFYHSRSSSSRRLAVDCHDF